MTGGFRIDDPCLYRYETVRKAMHSISLTPGSRPNAPLQTGGKETGKVGGNMDSTFDGRPFAETAALIPANLMKPGYTFRGSR
jgi:hypothetical protein